MERDIALLGLAVGRRTCCRGGGGGSHGRVRGADGSDSGHEVVRDMLQVRLDSRGVERLVVSQERQIARVVFKVGLLGGHASSQSGLGRVMHDRVQADAP